MVIMIMMVIVILIDDNEHPFLLYEPEIMESWILSMWRSMFMGIMITVIVMICDDNVYNFFCDLEK